ncbi:outer membrane transport energization protein ExbD [Mucilaginibacter yixingensis]|uniref:Outer membrane transport energization protein ExbD n=1 Tax=Mucilaginibacter yixingensis TaxID=1295612 RepID=A0A2T5JBW4_9SPHI|nr:biopolymer transporter ExbD [Mucilaginibacter yixingensis]PTQ99263.1 outer membrane transport energization protein ExbD [Mucilaginibacter yixingensis]
MPRVKIPRKSTAIDMTAMCDVAFLLLTFFILTAKPKTDDPVPVDIPASTEKVILPDANVAQLTVGSKKVFFSIDGDSVRTELVKQMAAKYKVALTESEVKQFAGMPNVGVPMGSLKEYLDLDPEKRKGMQLPGIPVDTTADNELYDWVRNARVVVKNLHNTELRIAIKGNSQEEYPTIATIIKTLQKQKVNKFALITALKSAPK